MKKIILSGIVLTFLFVACNSTSENANATNTTETTTTETTTMDTTSKDEMMMPDAEQKYACSMHPEEMGKKDDKCSKCGMNLTVKVEN